MSESSCVPATPTGARAGHWRRLNAESPSRYSGQRAVKIVKLADIHRLTSLLFLGLIVPAFAPLQGQDLNFTAVHAEVDFSKKLQTWDGFGFNYVETAHTYDYREWPQEYGGFSLLDAAEKQRIIDLVFGPDGLKVGLVKMFLGANHQAGPGKPYDHETTTRQMREFVREGLKRTRADGRGLQIITTLYGPPGWMTVQRANRGRDPDPEHRLDLAQYLVDWAKWLREREGFPVRYVSLHNEGEDWKRWNQAGFTERWSHDYNLHWPAEQVADFVHLVRRSLDEQGLQEVGVAPGETSNWYRFVAWGYADALVDDPVALGDLGLITSHGFYSGNYGRWFGEHASAGIDRLRERRPGLHAWVTSTSWSRMDARNIKEHHGNIYTAKVNGIIPWAGIQRPKEWTGGDPNPGSAFTVHEDGTFEVRRGYYFYKQVTRPGQPGTAVVRTSARDSEIALIGWAGNGTGSPDALVVINIGGAAKVNIHVKGTTAKAFDGFRTTEDETDRYAPIGSVAVGNGAVLYSAPAGSVTTFFAR